MLLLLPLYAFYKLYIYPVYRSPIRNLHGPVHPCRILTNLIAQFRGPPITLMDEYTEKHGSILRYSGMFGKTVLYVADPDVRNLGSTGTSVVTEHTADDDFLPRSFVIL